MRAKAEDEDAALARESEKTDGLEEQVGREEAAVVWATQLNREEKHLPAPMQWCKVLHLR